MAMITLLATGTTVPTARAQSGCETEPVLKASDLVAPELLNILARYHESVARLASVSAPGPILGRTAAGAIVVPAALDYVAWTERIGRCGVGCSWGFPRR